VGMVLGLATGGMPVSVDRFWLQVTSVSSWPLVIVGNLGVVLCLNVV
jgi:hypothetical protein